MCIVDVQFNPTTTSQELDRRRQNSWLWDCDGWMDGWMDSTVICMDRGYRHRHRSCRWLRLNFLAALYLSVSSHKTYYRRSRSHARHRQGLWSHEFALTLVVRPQGMALHALER